MFNIFNKQKTIENLPLVSEKMYRKEIQEIHNEFSNASDKLLEEANNIIKESQNFDYDKLKRLEKLGFSNSSFVKTVRPLLEKSKINEQQIKLVKYYKKEYPNNKFITENQVKEICKKYNLVFGNVSLFTGFIPKKKHKGY